MLTRRAQGRARGHGHRSNRRRPLPYQIIAGSQCLLQIFPEDLIQLNLKTLAFNLDGNVGNTGTGKLRIDKSVFEIPEYQYQKYR